MANGVEIVWEPDFEEQALHFRSSLNPLGDVVRETTNKIGARVKAIAEGEAQHAAAEAEATKVYQHSNLQDQKLRYFRAKAMSFSLKNYARMVRFYMVRAGDANYGMVAATHAAADKIEFGGKDHKIQLGKTGEYLEYPAFAFLRRGVSG